MIFLPGLTLELQAFPVRIPYTNNARYMASMSGVLQVKMVSEGDNLKIVLPKSYSRRLGLENGDTLLCTIEDEGFLQTRKNRRLRN